MATLVQRDADLSLRAAHDFVRPHVSWPADPPDSSPIAVVVSDCDADFDVADALCREGGFIVLALRTDALDAATVALEWVAEHARVLGGDPDRLVVAGGRLAAAAALFARDQGWPPLSRQVLIGAGLAGAPLQGASLEGVAPATVVDAPAYASRLREAGVEVEELCALTPDRVRALAPER